MPGLLRHVIRSLLPAMLPLVLLSGCFEDEGPSTGPNPIYRDSSALELQFRQMGPYTTHLLSVSVVDDTTGAVLADTLLDPLASDTLTLRFDTLLVKNRVYRLDIFSDVNQNKTYDAPPVDHAWRRRIVPLQDVERELFLPDTFFTNLVAPPAPLGG